MEISQEGNKKVLIVSSQASRIGHGAYHGQKLLAAFHEIGNWHTIFLTGVGFRKRISGMPLYGQIIETPIDLGSVGNYSGSFQAIRWGVKRRILIDRLFNYIDRLIEKYDVDIVFMLDGDISAIYKCWKRNTKKYPKVGWVVAHSLVDFYFSGFSIRSFYKWWVATKVKKMTEGMGSTVLFLGDQLREEFCNNLKISNEAKERIVITHFGADPDDMRLPRNLARESLGVPFDVNVALFFGLIRKDKRPDLAIKAVANASERWWLLMAGMPYSYTANEIECWIEEAGMQDRTRLILKYLSENEIRYVFSAANVLLAPHDHHLVGSSGPLTMCRTYRLPAIVSNNKYFSNIIEQDGIGFLAETGNALSFSDQLIKFDRLSRNDLEAIEKRITRAANKYSFLETAKNCIHSFEISKNFTNGTT